MAGAIAGTAPEGRNRVMIAAAVLFAAIAAVLLFVALQNGNEGGGGTSAAVTTDVVVAAQNIDTNIKLTADMLELAPISSDQVLSGAYSGVELAVGLPVRFPLQQGEQVTRSKLGTEAIKDEKDLALVLEPGMRGFSVLVSEVTGVGGLLLPGNFVDIVGSFPQGIAGQSRLTAVEGIGDLDEIKAVTLLQNIEILAVAQEAQEPIPAPVDQETDGATEGAEIGTGIRGERPDDVERQPAARSITFAVTPVQAQLLALIQDTGGKIWLTLRPVGETDDSLPDETNLLPLLTSPF